MSARRFFSTFIISLIAVVSATASDVIRELEYKPGDERNNKTKAIKTELMVSNSEKKAMEQLNKLLKQKRGTYIEPDLWFRLAELHMRRAKTDRFFELNRKDEQVSSVAPMSWEGRSEKRDINEAVQIYDNLQKRFPKYNNMDLVLFNNGFANQILKNHSRAKGLYNQLITSFPESSVLPDAYLSLGEMYFQDKAFEKALKYFESIKSFPESRVYPYGLYKMAWTQYNMRNAKAGLAELETLIAYGRKVQEQQLDSRLDLRKEALEDMALFYEDVYPAKQAFEYFKKPAEDFGRAPVLMRLVELYKSHSRYDDVAIVLKDIVERLPKSSYVPLAYNELVWNYETVRERRQSVGYIEKFHQICADDSSWMKTHKGKSFEDNVTGFTVSADLNCTDLLNDTSLKLASKWHRMWKKQPQFTEFAQVAEIAYRLYLDRNPTGADTNPARFNFAELLFQNKKYREASQNYAIVAENEKKDAQLRHDAGYGSLVSLEKAVEDKWNDMDTTLFKKLADVYFKGNPKGKYALDTKYKIGFIAYTNKRFEEAKPIFMEVGKQRDNLDLAKKSQDLLLDIMNAQKTFTNLKVYAKSLLAPDLDKERVDKLTKIYQEAYFSEIQNIEDKKDYKGAIFEYLKFSNENKTSPLAAKAWWNAIQLNFKIENYAEAALQAHNYAMAYPNDKESNDMLIKSAQSYEKIGRVSEAADVLMNLAKRDSKEVAKWELMAADYYAVSLPKKEEARKIYQKYVKEKSGKWNVQTIGKWYLLEKSISSAEHIKKLNQIILTAGIQPLAGEILLKELSDLMDAKRYKEAFEKSKRLVGQDDASSVVKATARYYQAMILEEEFRAQSLKARPDRLGQVLVLKTDKLEKAQKAYEGAIRYGVGKISVMAMKRLAECFSHYSQGLRGIALPEGISKEEGAAFTAELEKLALPMEEKAEMTRKDAMTLAKTHGGDDAENPTTAKASEVPSVVLPQIKEVAT